MAAFGFDALLVVSFGGPEGPDDVMPFLRNVTAGRGVPDERLELVAQHYLHRGGVSPINGHNRELVAALERLLAEQSIDLPVYWGNRNWHPFLADTVEQMAADGVGRAAAYVTSAFSSYSGCRQYRENIAAACDAVGSSAPTIEKLRAFHNHPLFIEIVIDRLRRSIDAHRRGEGPVRVVFTAHSIPVSMADTSDYVAQLTDAAELVAAGLSGAVPAVEWDLVWQSRSGPPQVPWLEPDIVDWIRTIGDDAAARAAANDQIFVVPLGFMSDHMEVIQDLDTDAAAAADEVGLDMVRVATAGADPRIPQMILELLGEREGGARRRVGALAVRPDECPADCCPAPRRPSRPGGRPGGPASAPDSTG